MTGLAFWHRTALPRAGGIGEQDARLMGALEHMADVSNAMMREAQERRQKAKKKKQRDDHGRH